MQPVQFSININLKNHMETQREEENGSMQPVWEKSLKEHLTLHVEEKLKENSMSRHLQIISVS